MVDLLLDCFGCRFIVFGVLLIGVCLWFCWCIACLLWVCFDFEWFVRSAALWWCFVVGFGVAWFECLVVAFTWLWLLLACCSVGLLRYLL